MTTLSDRTLGFIFISIMTALISTAVLFAYYSAGGIWAAVSMFYFVYLFTGFFIWMACLPESGRWLDFFGLVLGWYFAIVWVAIIKNGG